MGYFYIPTEYDAAILAAKQQDKIERNLNIQDRNVPVSVSEINDEHGNPLLNYKQYRLVEEAFSNETHKLIVSLPGVRFFDTPEQAHNFQYGNTISGSSAV